MPFEISKHTRDQILLRGIQENVITEILGNPDQIIQFSDKESYQAIVNEDDKQY